MKNLVFTFENKVVSIPIHGERNGFMYSLKKKYLPNPGSRAKVGHIAAELLPGNTIKVLQRETAQAGSNYPWREVNRFQASKAEKTQSGVNYWTKKWYGPETLQRDNVQLEDIPDQEPKESEKFEVPF